MQDFEVGKIKAEEIREAVDMIKGVFDKYIAPGYPDEGINEFLQFIRPESMEKRLKSGNLVLVARHKEKIIGIIEIRDKSHIALLFTEEKFQRQGVAKRLLQESILKSRLNNITVNSSPFAVGIYEKMGFVCAELEQVKNGIRFIPMLKRL